MKFIINYLNTLLFIVCSEINNTLNSNYYLSVIRGIKDHWIRGMRAGNCASKLHYLLPRVVYKGYWNIVTTSALIINVLYLCCVYSSEYILHLVLCLFVAFLFTSHATMQFAFASKYILFLRHRVVFAPI